MGRRQQDSDRTWWSRYWGWCVGCGCLVPLLAIAIVSAGVFFGTKNLIGNNEAIQEALQRVRTDARAVEALGEPIELSVWRENSNLSINIGDGKEGSMETTFGVKGPRGAGRVEIEARRPRTEERWILEDLKLYLDDHEGPIDLLEQAAPDPASSTLPSRPLPERQRQFDPLTVT